MIEFFRELPVIQQVILVLMVTHGILFLFLLVKYGIPTLTSRCKECERSEIEDIFIYPTDTTKTEIIKCSLQKERCFYNLSKKGYCHYFIEKKVDKWREKNETM
jgi:hypothetical protein